MTATPHPICDECQTVAHCSKNGCIPLTPLSEYTPPPAPAPKEAE